jgi:hypothetical protein
MRRFRQSNKAGLQSSTSSIDFVRSETKAMNCKLLIGTALVAALIAAGAPQPAAAFRGGFGGFHAGGVGGFRGGGAWRAGGWHAGGVGGVNAWHAGGVHGEWGGTWHGDGWHAGGDYYGGFHGPAVVNNYWAGGCYWCGGAAAWGAAAAVGAAAAAYSVGSLVATVPAGCPYQSVAGVNYYVCGGTWYQPYYGGNGVYYRVVAPR